MRSTITVPTWFSTFTLLVLHAYLGVGYLNSPPFAPVSAVMTYALDVMTLNHWGLSFLLGVSLVVLAAVKQDRTGAVASVLAAVPLAAFAGLLMIAEFDGTSARFGSAILFAVPIAMHAVMAWHSWRRDVVA